MLHLVRRSSLPAHLRLGFTALVALLAGLVPATSGHAQGSPRSAAILLLRGPDTIVVLRSTRGRDRVSTVVDGRGLPRITVNYELTPQHLVRRASFSAQGPGAAMDAPPVQRGTLEFANDTVHLSLIAGPNERTMHPATRAGALPLFNNDFTALEQGVRIARARGVSTLTMPLFLMANGQTIDGTLDLFAPDSARLSVMGNVSVASVDADGNVTGGYLPGQNITLRVLVGAEAARVSLGAPDYSAPAGAPYRAEPVEVRTPAGHTLTGTLTLPANARGRVPAVVTITGSGQQDRDESISIVPGYRLFRQVADTLGRRGIAVLRLDDRGVGGSGGDVNGTTADFADDIRAGVAYLRARSEIDGARIALVGHSEGGMIAPMVAADDPGLAAIVLMAGPADRGDSVIAFQLRSAVAQDPSIPLAARDSALVAVRAQFDSTSGKLAWMKYFLSYDPLPTIRRVRQPVLILQGATDLQVTADQAPRLERVLRDAGNRRVTTHVFAERNHLFLRDSVGAPAGYSRLPSGRVDAEVMGTLADWLVATLINSAQETPSWHRAVDSLVTAELTRTQTPGAQVAIAVGGEVVYSKAFGVADIETGRAVTPQTLFRVGSVTKMVTAAVIADLVAEGKLDLNAPISRYVTELSGRRVGTVTTHQLLTHTAGWIDNAIPYGRMGEGALGEVMREVTDTLFFTEPGRIISYSNPGYSMAGYVAERAGGQRFGAQADERVLRRLGMPHASFRPLEVMTRDFAQGHVGAPNSPGAVVRPFTENTAQWAAGFLMASAQDMARFTIALMNDGMLDGQRVMTSQAVRLLTTGMAPIPGDSIVKYGYGLSIGRQFGARAWQHGGSIPGFDANVLMFPEQRVSVVITDNRAGSPIEGLSALVARTVAGLTVPTPTDPPAPRAPTAAERAAIAGTYAQGRQRFDFAVVGNALMLRQGDVSVPVQMVGNDRISITPPGARALSFIVVRDAQGRVAYLHQSLRALARQ